MNIGFFSDAFIGSVSDVSRLQVQAVTQSIEDFGTVNLSLIDFSQNNGDGIKLVRTKKVFDFLKMLNYFRTAKTRDEVIRRD